VLDFEQRAELIKHGMNGVIEDKEDSRDYTFNAEFIAKLPTKVDMREFSGEIENQLNTGSCVANATCSALELMYRKEMGDDIDLSRLFVYYWAREPYPALKEKDGGAYMRDGFRVCNQMGVPLEEFWDFDVSQVNVKPSAISENEAPDNKAIRYERIVNNEISNIKNALSQGLPVIFGAYLTEEFYYVSGPIENQNYQGRLGYTDVVGGHAMNIVGYDDNLNGGSFIIENSWSTQWGDFGYCAFPYETYLSDAMDSWVCTEFKADIIKDINTPEDFDIEPENTLEEIKIWFHKMLRKVIDMIIELPSLNDVWTKMLEALKKMWETFKGVL